MRAPDALALSLVPGIGPVRWRALVGEHGSPGAALQAVSRGERDAAARQAEEAIRAAAAAGARVIVQGDAEYPASLLELSDPPACLFARGRVELLRASCVSIVGTRRSTEYGERVTREIAGPLARSGACIVSGLARGIDAAAHRAALEAGGDTIAVLGTGIDVAYPRANESLQRQIAARGLLLSEELPGARPALGSFPRRNRIVAALAPLTIVVEAGEKSGALITASCALDLGRTVAAVPGPIDAPQSAGANELLRDGASVIASVADALALAGLTPSVRAGPELGGTERTVWEALARGALDADALTAHTRLPAHACLAAVTALELRGAVECTLTGLIRRR